MDRRVTGDERFLYQRIAADLRSRIGTAEFSSGDLPGEIELAETYDVSRLTVRKALAELRADGLVESRRGSGWYVTPQRFQHSLEQLGTIEGELEARGMTAVRRILSFEFVQPDEHVREVLGCDLVLRIVRLNLGDGIPIARVTVWCPEEYGRDLSKAQVEQHSLYRLLPVSIGSAVQVITAVEAGPDDAELLDVPVGSACLRSERTTYDLQGRPILYAVGLFPGRHTEYVAMLRTSDDRQRTHMRLAGSTSPPPSP